MQTHLFHDRIMRMDTVVLEEGATLGPHCVALPAARIGAGATVGPASLVMRGDEVPAVDALAGQPDRTVDAVAQEARERRQAPRSQRKPPRDPIARKPAKGSPARHRPLPARQRQLRLPGVALRARPRVQGQRSTGSPGTATITAVTLRVAEDLHASTSPTRSRCRRCR